LRKDHQGDNNKNVKRVGEASKEDLRVVKHRHHGAKITKKTHPSPKRQAKIPQQVPKEGKRDLAREAKTETAANAKRRHIIRKHWKVSKKGKTKEGGQVHVENGEGASVF